MIAVAATRRATAVNFRTVNRKSFFSEDIMEKKKVLFVCVHNTARSQMAEAFLNAMAGEEKHGAHGK